MKPENQGKDNEIDNTKERDKAKRVTVIDRRKGLLGW